jgi:polar amino acid transport system substrate-binding protein
LTERPLMMLKYSIAKFDCRNGFFRSKNMRNVALFVTALLLNGSQAMADDITVLYNQRPPYLVESGGSVSGLTGAPVDAAFKKAGIPFKWESAPSNRQMTMIKESQTPVCAAGWFKNPEREAFGRFTAPIYQDKPTVILTRGGGPATAHHTVESLLADAKMTVLVKSGYSYGRFIDDKLPKAAAKKSSTTQENIGMATMIAENRADFMFLAAEEGSELLKAPELTDKGLVLADLTDMPPGNQRYLLCSRSVTPETIEALNRAIAAP